MTFAATANEKGKKVLTMAEYIEREATIELLRSIGSRDYRREKGTIQEAIKMISFSEYTPAADVAPVVRCQDCVYARPLKDMNYDYLCHYWNGHSCNQNQFCSQGKRKEKTK